jgi:hypothetical protein
MDSGKILIGFAFVILSVALIVSPSNARMQDLDGNACCGYAEPYIQPTALSPMECALPANTRTLWDANIPADQDDLP